MTPKIKNIIIVLVVLIIFVLVYIFVIKKSPEEDALVSSTPDATATANAPADQDFLTVLLGVRNLTLQNAIFSDPAFKSLVDNSVLLTLDTSPGRPNPFAPIGSDSTSSPFGGGSTATPPPETTTPPPTVPPNTGTSTTTTPPPVATPPVPPATP